MQVFKVLPVILALASPLSAGPVLPAAAQTDVTSADIQRIQDSISQSASDIAQLRSRDSSLASELEQKLSELRDEATYLKVKAQKKESISRREYTDLRDKVEALRNRASARTSSSDDVPVGTEFDVRLQKSLSSATAQVEDRFEATTAVDLKKGDKVVVPGGAVMRGVISSVTKATRLERKGGLTAVFDRITIDSRSYPIRATVTQALESEGIRGEATKIGAGAGVGAIIGGILGGAKGVLAGILIGGGGTIAATEGKDVELPAGTLLRVRLDTPLDLH